MLGMGKTLRLNKLMNPRSGTAVIIPMDHGIEGYFAELADPAALIASLAEAGVNGFLTRPGLARRFGPRFGGAGWVQRLTGRSGIGVSRQPALDLDQLRISSVEQALRDGADAVVPTYFFGGPQEPRVLPEFGTISDKCAELGLPLLAEVFPVGEAGAEPYNGPYTVDDMRLAVRLAGESGGDLIKTWYSGDPASFRKIVAYSLVPVLIAGGPKANSDIDVLTMVKGAMDAGAKGTTVGRKIWQAPNPAAMVRAVSLIVHEGADVDRAMRALR
jgi:DhnA family fructose-bisphosphate aldolase class Ia